MARLELKGTSVSPGIAVGRAVLAVQPAETDSERRISPEQVPAAIALFEAARRRAIAGLESVQTATAKELGIQDAAIYGAQVAVLQDPAALSEIHGLVENELYPAELAIQSVVEKFGKLFDQLEGGDIKNWAADLRDPWFAVQRELSLDSKALSEVEQGEGPIILFGDELAPGLLTRVPRERLAAVVCERGGRFSHGAVVARSFGVPSVTAVEGVLRKVEEGEDVVVVAQQGRVELGVTNEERAEAERRASESAAVHGALLANADRPAVSRCGAKIDVFVNVESPRDLSMVSAKHVDGVGLFRTEFAYMERPTFPSVAEQAEMYREVLSHFAGKPVTFRTLDIGNDKQLRYFTMPEEANPALGWRGLRLGLDWRDLLLVQIQALMNATDTGEVKILLPMVTLVDEVRQVRQLIENMLPAGARAPQLGCMIEVPAAAMALKELAQEVDFVSVGTNDLVQYLFAVDRDNPWVAGLYQPYHPAHLRVLRHIAKTCRETGTPVSVCGEMAAEPEGALFLLGAGFDSLSVSAPFVPELKALIRQVDRNELADLARQAAACEGSEDAFGLLEQHSEAAWEAAVAGLAQRRP